MITFREFLLVKGLTPVTVDNHINTIKRVRGVIGKFNHNNTTKYIAQFYDSGYSYSHKTQTAKGIEYYMEYKDNPIYFGRQKRPNTIIKDTLTEGEITSMFLSCKNTREKAILSLLAYSGLRNKEIRNLKTSDVDTCKNKVRVIKGKGEYDGISYITPECSKIINNYLYEYPRKNEDFLFTTLIRGNKLGSHDLRKWIKIFASRANINKRVYPYLLRHSLATSMLLRGADIWAIKQQLRHRFISSTMVYIYSVGFGERNDYEKFAPSYL